MIQSTVIHTHPPSFTYTFESAHAYIKHISFPKRDQPKSHPVTWSSFMAKMFGMRHSPLFQISCGSLVPCPPQPHLVWALRKRFFFWGFSALGYISWWCTFDSPIPGSPYSCLEELCPQCLPSCLLDIPGQLCIPGSAGGHSTTKYQTVSLSS